MSSNQFQPFAIGSGANALTPTAYAALTTLISQGFQSGVANSSQFNTVLRQASFVAAAVAQLIANNGVNANDDGNLSTFVTNLANGIGTALAGTPAFGNSLGSSGYQKLPGGLVFQWGKSSTVASLVTVTFPIAFPTAILGVVVTPDRLGSVGGVISIDDGVAFSTTQAAVRKANTDDSFLYMAWGY